MTTIQEVRDIYSTPLLELVYRAAGVHRAHHAGDEVQRCTLLSVKTGGCPEDCGDGMDNDGDMDVDCMDSDCLNDPLCVCP